MGAFTPSPSQWLLHELKDELLVIASGVGVEARALSSGSRVFQLLAWTVADACDAVTAFDKPLHERWSLAISWWIDTCIPSESVCAAAC